MRYRKYTNPSQQFRKDEKEDCLGPTHESMTLNTPINYA